MSKFQKQSLEIVEQVKNNPEYSHIKKEALIELGFEPIEKKKLIEWILLHYEEDVEEIIGGEIPSSREYTEDTEISLLSKDELKQMGVNLGEEEINPNQIIGYITADSETTSAQFDIENRKRKERYTLLNKKEWTELGQALKQERLELGIKLTDMGRMLNTSPSRIANLENGNPVMMADHLRASYKLVLDVVKMQQNDRKDRKIDHVEIKQYGEGIYIMSLITESGNHIHIEDFSKELEWVLSVARTKFAKPLNVPIILKLDNGEKVRLDTEFYYC